MVNMQATTPMTLSQEIYHRKEIPKSLDPFIIATDKDSIKPDSRGRRFIRQHVMKGRNRRRVVTRPTAPKSWLNLGNDLLEPPTRLNPEMNVSPSLVGFGADIDSYMLQHAYKFINIMQSAMYPIEDCIDIREDSRHWFEDLVYDPEYAKTIYVSSQAYFDIINSQTPQSTAMAQINMAIAMLLRKLSAADMMINDSMIFLVLSLAMMSEKFNDLDAAEKHLHGLHELIKLHGGITALSRKRLLQVKCCRLDLRYALRTGSKSLFFLGMALSWEPYLFKPTRLSTTMPLDVSLLTIDERLMNIWLDLRELATAVDLAHQTTRQLSPVLFQESLLSTLYRLERLVYNVHDRNEVLRMTLLVFASSTFLHTSFFPVHHKHLARLLEHTVDRSDCCNDNHSLQLRLWIIYVVGPGLDATQDRAWLCSKMLQVSRSLNLCSWSDIRKLLKSFLWVDLIKGQGGESFLKEALRYDRTHGGDL